MKKYSIDEMDLGEKTPRSNSSTEGQLNASKGIISLNNEKLRIGVWECTQGTFGSHRETDDEVSYIISGSAEITDNDTKEKLKVQAGDILILPIGWKGDWEIIEPIRKIYISHKP